MFALLADTYAIVNTLMIKTLTPEEITRSLELNIKICESDLQYQRDLLKRHLERLGGE